MYVGLIASLTLHVFILMFGYFGIPILRDPVTLRDEPMWVELLNVSENSNILNNVTTKPEPEPIQFDFCLFPIKTTLSE